MDSKTPQEVRVRIEKSIAPGVGICLIIASAAWVLGQNFVVVGGAIFAIIIGMAVRLFWNPPGLFGSGIKFASKKVLQYAIIFLGFQMNIVRVLETGRDSLFLILLSLSSAFLAAYFVGRILKIESNTNILIGVGTAICGGSAIAAAAPVIGADDQEIAQSISTIFLFNIVAVFAFPVLGRLLGMSDAGFGIWAGVAINDTSSVTAAAISFSAEALTFAVIVKLTRTLMIIPVTVGLAFKTPKEKNGGKIKITNVFPFFILGFIGTSLVATSGMIPAATLVLLAQLSKFMIVVAMSAIGLSTDVVSLVKNGKKPIALGFICWAAVAVATISAMAAIKIR